MVFCKKNKFLVNHSNNDNINEFDFDNYYKLVSEFYNFNKKIEIKIYFLQSLEEFNFFNPYGEFKNWSCGFLSGKIIYVLSPNIIEKLTIHKKEEIPEIIIHEMSHLFYYLSEFRNISLINEGLATYLMDLYKKRDMFSKDINLNEINIIDPKIPKNIQYSMGRSIVSNILKKFSKKKLFDFLIKSKNSSNIDIIKEFKEEFKD